jgi:uncharacterized protein
MRDGRSSHEARVGSERERAVSKPSRSVDKTTSSPPVASSVESATRKRGFAALSPERVRALARRGGLAAHQQGNAHEFTSEEARAAGRKGGLATHSRSRARALESVPVEEPSSSSTKTRTETTP